MKLPASLQKIMNPTPKTDVISDAEALETCAWFRAITAAEETYFVSADNCHAMAREAQATVARLRAQLRQSPEPELWRELARAEAVVVELAAASSNAPFRSRRDRFTDRTLENPGAIEQVKVLASWAEAYVAPRLLEAEEADKALTAQWSARDLIVSGRTRQLQGLAHVLSQLRDRLALHADDDRGEFWLPFQGVVAAVEEELK